MCKGWGGRNSSSWSWWRCQSGSALGDEEGALQTNKPQMCPGLSAAVAATLDEQRRPGASGAPLCKREANRLCLSHPEDGCCVLTADVLADLL